MHGSDSTLESALESDFLYVHEFVISSCVDRWLEGVRLAQGSTVYTYVGSTKLLDLYS